MFLLAPDEKINLLCVSQGFASSENDRSSVVYLQNYFEYLKQNYPVDLTLVAMQYPFEKKKYDWHGIPVIALGGYKKSRAVRLKRWLFALASIIKLHRKRRFTHIHAFWLQESAFFGYLLSKFLSLPLYCTLMGTELEGKNVFRFLVRKGSIRFICLSDHHKGYLEDKSGLKVDIVIPWGVKENKISPAKEKETDILFVGYLNEVKNFDLFLEVTGELAEKMPGIKAGVIGDFFGLDRFRKQVSELGLERNVFFYGLLNNEDVLGIMARSKVLVHTSDFETQGYAMLEALSMGMYVVSKKVGIADASQRWKIARPRVEFVNTVMGLLSNYNPPEEGLVPYSMAETCKEYMKVYDRR